MTQSDEESWAESVTGHGWMRQRGEHGGGEHGGGDLWYKEEDRAEERVIEGT